MQSPDGRNLLILHVDDLEPPRFQVKRDGHELVRPSAIRPLLAGQDSLCVGASSVEVRRSEIKDRFTTPWGKTSSVLDHCNAAVVAMTTPTGLRWEIELRASNDGVAFRYRVPTQGGLDDLQLRDETTQFDIAGEPTVLFNTLNSFQTSHESLYQHRPLSEVPARTLIDMPLLLRWPDAGAAAFTEARVRDFAGGYLERSSLDSTALRLRLSPLETRDNRSVARELPCISPWRVVLLADEAGKLLESNLLLCLNDPPQGGFDWLQPGKTTWHWWNGDFEEDHRLPKESSVSLDRHRKYIDFCADHGIAYHAVSGDGFAWYQQSKTGYGRPAQDADVRRPRAQIRLPKILEYADQRGVGIRLWVHWEPLSQHLEEAFSLYESWGVKGVMVDFINRDDQDMIELIDRILRCAARHKLHVQLHGCAKFSGEQRTFPHLLNREGVLNLEVAKWDKHCSPDHNVNVAYTRAIVGPVDYHLGGFRSVSRAEFLPRDRSPQVTGTRCHHLALYVVYENPMPMVADSPEAYGRQDGFDFITKVPTTWDETKFLAGTAGEFAVIARRKNETWYIGGITNWTSRRVELPMNFLGQGTYEATLHVDGSMEESQPNSIRIQKTRVDSQSRLGVSLAPGGGFVLVLQPQR